MEGEAACRILGCVVFDTAQNVLLNYWRADYEDAGDGDAGAPRAGREPAGAARPSTARLCRLLCSLDALSPCRESLVTFGPCKAAVCGREAGPGEAAAAVRCAIVFSGAAPALSSVRGLHLRCRQMLHVLTSWHGPALSRVVARGAADGRRQLASYEAGLVARELEEDRPTLDAFSAFEEHFVHPLLSRDALWRAWRVMSPAMEASVGEARDAACVCAVIETKERRLTVLRGPPFLDLCELPPRQEALSRRALQLALDRAEARERGTGAEEGADGELLADARRVANTPFAVAVVARRASIAAALFAELLQALCDAVAVAFPGEAELRSKATAREVPSPCRVHRYAPRRPPEAPPRHRRRQGS